MRRVFQIIIQDPPEIKEIEPEKADEILQTNLEKIEEYAKLVDSMYLKAQVQNTLELEKEKLNDMSSDISLDEDLIKKLNELNEKLNELSEKLVEKLKNQSKNILENYNGVSALGIQAYPGTKFCLSQDEEGNPDKSFPIIIGPTGIYQVDLKEYGTISYLSLEETETKQDIIIDILCKNKIDEGV